MSFAIISKCDQFRYVLTRGDVQYGRPLMFVMLNPSTADALTDDPTIRRCQGFAKDWGYDSIIIGNLYAFRTKSPAVLKEEGYLVGPDCDNLLSTWASKAETVVCAWGNHGQPKRIQQVVKILTEAGHPELFCLGTNKSGSPKHPLYIPKDMKPRVWVHNLCLRVLHIDRQ